MEKYHIANNGKVLGVYTIDELKAISFNDDTLIWKKGMSEWKKAGEIDELKDILEEKDSGTPPPFDFDSELPPPVPVDLEEKNIFENIWTTKVIQIPFIKKQISPANLLVVIVFILILISITFYQITKITAERIPLSDILKHELYQKEKGRESIEEYEILVKQNPKSYEVYYLLGRLYYDMRIYKKSDAITVEKLLIKSLELKQDFFYSNALLASLYYEQKKLSDAKNFAVTAQKINSEDANMKSIIFQVNENEQKLKEEAELLRVQQIEIIKTETKPKEYSLNYKWLQRIMDGVLDVLEQTELQTSLYMQTGEYIDTSRLQYFAETNDEERFQKEFNKLTGNLEQFKRLNRIAQQTKAEMFIMSRESFINMLQEKEFFLKQ